MKRFSLPRAPLSRLLPAALLCCLLIGAGSISRAGDGAVSKGQAAQTTPPAVGEPLLRTPFTSGPGGWVAGGGNSKLTPTRETDKPALRWDYTVQKGDLSALTLPIASGALARANVLRFSVKSAILTPLVVLLQEKNGGRYLAIFSAPADIWQTVELAPNDFVLAEGKTDPKDANKRLDMDQIESVSLADLTQFVVQGDNAALISLFGVKTGDKHLFLADWAFYHSAGGAKGGYDIVAGRLDTFTHPHVGWMALNAASVKQADSKLAAAYHQSDEHPLILTRAFPIGLLAHKAGISLTFVSNKPAKMVVQVETRSGNKWKTMFDIAGQKTRKVWTLPLADFAPDEANTLVNGKPEALDFADVHQLTLLDISGITDAAIDDNVLIVSDVIAK